MSLNFDAAPVRQKSNVSAGKPPRDLSTAAFYQSAAQMRVTDYRCNRRWFDGSLGTNVLVALYTRRCNERQLSGSCHKSYTLTFL